MKREVEFLRFKAVRLTDKYERFRTDHATVLIALSNAQRDLVAKSSEVDTVLRDWAPERSTFLIKALREHEFVSTERNANSARLISLDSDVGRLQPEVANANFARDSVLAAKADEHRRVSEMADLDTSVSALLIENFQVVRDGILSVFRGEMGASGALSVPVVPSVASFKIEFVDATFLLALPSVST